MSVVDLLLTHHRSEKTEDSYPRPSERLRREAALLHPRRLTVALPARQAHPARRSGVQGAVLAGPAGRVHGAGDGAHPAEHPVGRPASRLRRREPWASYDECKNRLGNFTLLEKPINIVAGNGFFEAKKAEYRKCKHYLTSSVAGLTAVGKNSSITRINERLIAFDAWTAAGIEQRQVMLIELVKDVWKTSMIEGG